MRKNDKNGIQNNTMYRSDEYYRDHFGKDVIVTRLGRINIVHCDKPSKQEIQKRIEEVMREEITDTAFEDDCPLCQLMKDQPYDIVYYDQDEDMEAED